MRLEYGCDHISRGRHDHIPRRRRRGENHRVIDVAASCGGGHDELVCCLVVGGNVTVVRSAERDVEEVAELADDLDGHQPCPLSATGTSMARFTGSGPVSHSDQSILIPTCRAVSHSTSA